MIIKLTKGYETEVDDVDSDLANYSWYTLITKRGKIYAARSVRNGKSKFVILLHKVILERILNRKIEKCELTDHKDSNGLNNKRDNLRLADNNTNSQNRKIQSNNKSGYKGVSLNKNSKKWIAYIRKDGKTYNLGSFDNPKDAHKAYCKKAKELFGEFARYE